MKKACIDCTLKTIKLGYKPLLLSSKKKGSLLKAKTKAKVTNKTNAIRGCMDHKTKERIKRRKEPRVGKGPLDLGEPNGAKSREFVI